MNGEINDKLTGRANQAARIAGYQKTAAYGYPFKGQSVDGLKLAVNKSIGEALVRRAAREADGGYIVVVMTSDLAGIVYDFCSDLPLHPSDPAEIISIAADLEESQADPLPPPPPTTPPTGPSATMRKKD